MGDAEGLRATAKAAEAAGKMNANLANLKVEKRAADAAEICTRTADVLEGKFSPNSGKLVATAERRPFPARSRG